MNKTAPSPAWLLAVLLLPIPALAVPDGPIAESAAPGATAAPNAAMTARLAYNIGYGDFEQAQAEDKLAASLTGAKAKASAEKQRALFTSARVKFDEATKADPSLKEAWNLVGYTSRRLGDYARSLAAYEKALALDPAYGEAIEYRAEAYLALNRLDEAKAAYLSLLASARNHADVLMDAMRRWVADRRRAPAGVAAAEVDAFAKWVDERSSIAKQTASLNLDRSVVRRWD